MISKGLPMNHTLGFNQAELKILTKLSTPLKIQDFLQTLKMNFGDDYRSPRVVLETRTAHCLDGALLAAAALWLHNQPPLLLDLKSGRGDDDHVVALFRYKNFWGAISKTNHAVLRYRDPIYKSIRELAMTYFHEYSLDDGRKTLKSYSEPLNLRIFSKRGWTVSPGSLGYIAKALDAKKHLSMVPPGVILRPTDLIERKSGKYVEYRKS
jgi:hypothetical protein